MVWQSAIDREGRGPSQGIDGEDSFPRPSLSSGISGEDGMTVERESLSQREMSSGEPSHLSRLRRLHVSTLSSLPRMKPEEARRLMYGFRSKSWSPLEISPTQRCEPGRLFHVQFPPHWENYGRRWIGWLEWNDSLLEPPWMIEQSSASWARRVGLSRIRTSGR